MQTFAALQYFVAFSRASVHPQFKLHAQCWISIEVNRGHEHA
jgi:hypothetical protein